MSNISNHGKKEHLVDALCVLSVIAFIVVPALLLSMAGTWLLVDSLFG